MGSSGGSHYPRVSPDLDQLVSDARSVETERLNTIVNDYLRELLTRFNDRDVEGTNARLDKIARVLCDVVEVDRILLGGSVAKHTAVDGISDVDALVVLEGPKYRDNSPGELKARFRDELHTQLPRSEVRSVTAGDMAVTVTYTDGTEVQLVPVLRSGTRTLIGSPDGSTWNPIKPQAFQEALSATNRQMGNGLVPAIKLMKAMNDALPKQKQLKGYHMEALAIDAAKNYSGPLVPREILIHLVRHASDRVLSPIADITGQSKQADEYLGAQGSVARRIVAQSLSGIRRRLEAASSLEDWKAAFQ